MKKLLFLSIMLMLSEHAFSKDCVKPITAVHEGEKVECDGFLFTKAKEKEVRLTKEQLDLKFKEINLQVKKSLSQNTEISNYAKELADEQQKTKEWQEVAEKYTQRYEDAASSRATRDAIFFGLGVGFAIVTGIGIVWIVTHAGVTAGAALAAAPK